MSLSKLRRIHIVIIGSVLIVLAAALLYYFVIKPSNEALKVATARYDAAYPVGNEQSKAAAQQAILDAEKQVNLVKAQLDTQMKKRMPALSFGRRDVGMLSYWQEQIKHMGPLLETFAKDPSVNMEKPSFSLPAPPVNPNDPIFDQTMITYPLGTISAEGDYSSLMKNVVRWNTCPRLVMVGPVSLSGTSPNLLASYELTCYVFPLSLGGPTIPLASGGTSTGAAPAAGVAGAATGASAPAAGNSKGVPNMGRPGGGMGRPGGRGNFNKSPK